MPTCDEDDCPNVATHACPECAVFLCAECGPGDGAECVNCGNEMEGL